MNEPSSINLAARLAALAAMEEAPPLYRIDDPHAPDEVRPCWIYNDGTTPHATFPSQREAKWHWDESAHKQDARFGPDGKLTVGWHGWTHWTPGTKDRKPPPPPPLSP